LSSPNTAGLMGAFQTRVLMCNFVWWLCEKGGAHKQQQVLACFDQLLPRPLGFWGGEKPRAKHSVSPVCILSVLWRSPSPCNASLGWGSLAVDGHPNTPKLSWPSRGSVLGAKVVHSCLRVADLPSNHPQWYAHNCFKIILIAPSGSWSRISHASASSLVSCRGIKELGSTSNRLQ